MNSIARLYRGLLAVVLAAAFMLPFPAEGRRKAATASMLKQLTGNELSISLDSLEMIVAPLDTFGLDRMVHRDFQPIPEVYFAMPAVYNSYRFVQPVTLEGGMPRSHPVFGSTGQWLDDEAFREQLTLNTRQQFMIAHPELVKYNYATLPAPPPPFRPEINPSAHKLAIEHVLIADAIKRAEVNVKVDRRDWLHSLAAALQFSQSYISPNWYQGGYGNINVIVNTDFNVKLNQAFHPKLLCEMDVFYKLGANNAPTDTVNKYNISEDNFRITGRVGYKAFRHWFYSVNMQFKTQLFNSYKQNSNQRSASFLSPGELNLGLGMTYTYASSSGNLTIDSSISPAAWNLKTCIDPRVDPTTVGIKAGYHTANQLGFTTENKLTWKIMPNIQLTSRLFMFTDYHYLQGDLETTIDFALTRFLTTRIFAHLRYDDSTPPTAGTSWHCWQFKEILSVGFSYTFTD